MEYHTICPLRYHPYEFILHKMEGGFGFVSLENEGVIHGTPHFARSFCSLMTLHLEALSPGQTLAPAESYMRTIQ